MEPNSENSEVVFFKEEYYLVTDKRVCNRSQSVKIGDIQRVEIAFRNDGESYKYYIHWTLLVLGFLAGSFYGAMFLFLIPGFVAAFIHYTGAKFIARLLVHTKSGTVSIAFAWSRAHFVSKGMGERYEADLKIVETIKNAVSEAMSYSPSLAFNNPQKNPEPISRPLAANIADEVHLAKPEPNQSQPVEIVVTCNNIHCRQQMRIKSVDITTTLKCPKCQNVFSYSPPTSG